MSETLASLGAANPLEVKTDGTNEAKQLKPESCEQSTLGGAVLADNGRGGVDGEGLAVQCAAVSAEENSNEQLSVRRDCISVGSHNRSAVSNNRRESQDVPICGAAVLGSNPGVGRSNLAVQSDLTGEKSPKKRRGRPRNPDFPPPIGKYLYWKPNSGGFSLEKKNPKTGYEYLGFLLPADWEHLRGTYDTDSIVRKIRVVLAVKRLLTIERRQNRG